MNDDNNGAKVEAEGNSGRAASASSANYPIYVWQFGGLGQKVAHRLGRENGSVHAQCGYELSEREGVVGRTGAITNKRGRLEDIPEGYTICDYCEGMHQED